MKPESAIDWFLRILPDCTIPLHLSWEEIQSKVAELRWIQQQVLTTENLFCPAPGCLYKCVAPKEMDSTDAVVCPLHSTPLVLMTWKQLLEEASAVMELMKEKMRLMENNLDELSFHSLQAAQRMRDAHLEAAEARKKLDNMMFLDACEREELEQLRELKQNGKL